MKKRHEVFPHGDRDLLLIAREMEGKMREQEQASERRRYAPHSSSILGIHQSTSFQLRRWSESAHERETERWWVGGRQNADLSSRRTLFAGSRLVVGCIRFLPQGFSRSRSSGPVPSCAETLHNYSVNQRDHCDFIDDVKPLLL